MSLRLRVVALISLVLMISLIMGSLVAGYQTKQALHAELSAGVTGAAQTVQSAFEDLPRSDHIERDLHQLVATFDGNRHVQAKLLDAEGRVVLASRTGTTRSPPPRWFRHLLGPSPADLEVRVPEGVRGFYAIMITPTADIDVGDAWAEFGSVVLVLAGSTALGLLLVSIVIGAAFRPLTALSLQFSRIGMGDFSGRIVEKGPTELIILQKGFNSMAGELERTTVRNRLLANQLLTIQDEERADIARDLHDDIGPHLFAVNIDAELIGQMSETGRIDAIPGQVRAIQAAVTHMQAQVRELLGRLRPTLATEFGLNAAIEDLVRFWGVRRVDIAFQLKLLEDESQLKDAIKDVAFRVVQEAVNNAVRHAQPSMVQIAMEIQNQSDLMVMVFDDGAKPGLSYNPGGMGLIGMRERVADVSGSLIFGQSAGGRGWMVVARIPIRPSMPGALEDSVG